MTVTQPSNAGMDEHGKELGTALLQAIRCVPLSQGGTHDRENLIALCKSCHARIHAKSGDRWHNN